MVMIPRSMRSRRFTSVLRCILYGAVLLALAQTGQAQTLGPDAATGVSWGNISQILGAGTASAQAPIPNGTLASALSGFPQGTTSVATDSHGNVYLGTIYTGASNAGGLIYMIYMGPASGGPSVPPWLAAITTQASPAQPLVTGGIYLIAGGADGTNGDPNGYNCSLNAPSTCQDSTTGPLNASFGSVVAMAFDAGGNLYTVDGSGVGAVRRLGYAAPNNVTSPVGTLNTPDTYPDTLMPAATAASSALLYADSDIKFDAVGNMFLVDGFTVVRVVYLADPVPPILTAAGYGTSGMPALVKGNIYIVAGEPGVNCAGAPCGDNVSALTAQFGYPYGVEVDANGNLFVSDAELYTIRAVYAGVTTPPILKPVTTSPTAGNIYTVAGQSFMPCTPPACGDTQPAQSALLASFVNPQHMRSDTQGDLYVDDAGAATIRKIDAAGYISDAAGSEAPGTTSSGAGGPVTQAVFQLTGDFTIDANNNLLIVDGSATTTSSFVWEAAPAATQVVASFPATATGTYGQALTFDAVAESSSGTATGLAVNYSYSLNGGPSTAIPGSSLVLPGAGTLVVTANVAGGVGNGTVYAPAMATQTIAVSKATLTVTADDKSALYDQPIPPLTASYTGFVNGDTSNVLSGAPALSDGGLTAGANAGTYPITVTAGSLASANYAFVFVAGTLHITGATAQTITFNPLPSITYGQVQTIVLAATLTPATPARAITYTIGSSDPATISGSTLTITGGGTITVTASQFGNNTFEAATPVTQSFTVTPAPLTITGPSVSLPYNTAINPASFPPPTITGFVNGDTSALITGSPTYTTDATGTPNAGSTFPINVVLNTLALVPSASRSYSFVTPPTPGTLTIVPAAQTISFNQLNPVSYGLSETAFALAKDASGNPTNLPVTLTVSNNGIATFNSQASTSITPSQTAQLGTVSVGTVTVTATQSGSTNYAAAAPVSQTITVNPGLLNVTANSFTRELGAANPTLTYFLGCPTQGGYTPGCFANSDTDIPSVITGVPTVTVNADATTAPGTYPIVVSLGTLSAPNYTLVPVNGTLTITPAGSYTITPSAPTLTIAAGHAGQLTLTVTPTNFYQGTITMSCGTLPANVSCIFSPATYTFTGATNIVGGVNPAQGTLTINTLGGQPVVGALTGPGSTMLAAAFLLPGALATLLITWRRRAASARWPGIWQAVIVLLLSAGTLGLGACGSSSSSGTAVAATGTVNLTITGTGTTATGTGNVTQTLNVSVVIQ